MAIIQIIKVKNDVPTVIEVNGLRYVLDLKTKKKPSK